MQEGSRHEKATLVALAYGIGALTAFIWFGIDKLQLNSNFTEFTSIQSASVIESLPVDLAQEAAVTVPDKTKAVSYANGLLQYTALDGVRLLSFNTELNSDLSSSGFEEQGYHYGQLVYLVSPSEEYVFFCEQKASEAETCRPFVYDALTDSIYPVRKNSNLVDLLVSAASAVSWNGSTLTIGSDSSISSAKPWLLGL